MEVGLLTVVGGLTMTSVWVVLPPLFCTDSEWLKMGSVESRGRFSLFAESNGLAGGVG